MNKPIVKNLILIGIPAIISTIGIIMTLDALSSFKDFFIFLTFALLISLIIVVIYYGKVDKNEQKAINELEQKNQELLAEIDKLKTHITSITNLLNTNNSIVSSFVSIIEPWTRNISKITHDVQRYGRANGKDWDYEKICTDICVGCKDAIRHFKSDLNDTDISVGFIKFYTKDDKEYVKMIAHSSPQTAKPDIYDVEELLTECNYQYARLIRDKTRSILVYENNEKIAQCFYKKHPETNLTKYAQYIAIPILCNKNKSLGVLQVTTKYGHKIMDSEIDLRIFGENYITPFVELLILVEKLQKGLYMKPSYSVTIRQLDI